MLGLADQAALANDECGVAPASGGKIVCNPSNYDPATDGNIVYQLVGDDDYEIEFRDLKGAKGIVIDSADSPHSYFTSRPNAVWIDHRGPGNLSAFVSGIELTTTAADAGSANARGFNLTLWSGADNDATTTDPTNGAEISLIRRDLVLTVEKSVFNTYARALTGVHLGTGDIQIDVTDTQITTTGPSGHGIVGWHETNGNVNVNAERVKIVSPQGYGVGGFVWSQLKFGRTQVSDPGDKTLSLSVRDSEIQAGTYGLYARHRGSGKIDILLSDSSITTAGLNGYGIFTRNDTRNATDNMDISVNVVNSKITTAAANTHGITIFRQENPDSTGTNRITVDSDSQIETGDGGHGIFAQGESDITVDGRIAAGSGGHGIYVGSAGMKTIQTGSDSQIEVDGAGKGIFAQGASDVTVGGRITASGDGHGVHVDGTGGTERNTIQTGSGSRIEVKGAGAGIYAQGMSDVTVGGRITASGDGHGVHVDGTGGTDKSTIETGADSRIEIEGAGTAIYAQGVSDVTVGGRITVSGDGHGIHVDGTGGTGKNTIETGANSRIEVEGEGTAIYAQGVSDVTVEGRITASGGGHGIHVDGTSETGTGGTGANMNLIALSGSGSGIHASSTHSADTNTIRTGINSRIEVEGDGYGIKTQGRSIITIEGQIVAETKVAAHNTGGDLDVILRGNARIDGQQVWNQNRDGHNLDVEVYGAKLVDDGEVIQRTAPKPESVYDLTVKKVDSEPDFDIVEFGREFGPRAFIYESLPETLHTLNRLSTWQERGRAKSQAEPFWMRAEGSRATREPTDSTTGTDWQMDRWVLQAGYGFLVGEGFEAGVSVHYGDSSTDVSGATELGGGEIDTESYGLGASLTWRLQNGVYFDAQGAANWYDIDLSGTARGTLKSGVDGTGWALALEAGRRLEMTQLTVTPHVRVVYSEVDPDSFVDKFEARVSSDSDDRTLGGLGVTFEGSQGWVLAEFQREFGTGTSVDVSGTSLNQRMSRSRARIAMGGEMSVLQDKLTLRGELGAASDISSSAEDTEVKAGITAHMSF